MINERYMFSASNALFDTYLIYGIVGLLLLIAIVGLIILLATSCCCCYCCLPSRACCLCFHHRRHSSYKVRQQFKHTKEKRNEDSKNIVFIRRHPSDVADFSQLYDSCPHLINSKAMASTGTNMNNSCTTIDTLISPISPCSSLRSFVGPVLLPTSNGNGGTINNKPPTIQSDLTNLMQKTDTNNEKSNEPPTSSGKGVGSRPFSYIKNTNDRTQISRRFTPHERISPVSAIPVEIVRVSSLEHDITNQTNANCTNIYETVPPLGNNKNDNINSPSISVISTPIYETEWTHSIRQLMMTTASSTINENVPVAEVSVVIPDVISSTKQSVHCAQHQRPRKAPLKLRSVMSDPTKRTDTVKQLNDNAAFLY